MLKRRKMLNNCGIFIITLVNLFTLAASIGFKGQITDIPSNIEEIYQAKNVQLMNGNNYQSKFDISLIKVENTTENLQTSKSILNRNYEFVFDNIDDGEYVLNVISYDFILEQTRFRVIVEDEIKIYIDNFVDDTYNKSSETVVGYESPLLIPIKEVKQFYESSNGSLTDLVMASPFGFIFRNRLYTIFFIISLLVIVAPYILNWINPEFSKVLEEIQTEAKSGNNQQETESELLPTLSEGTASKSTSSTRNPRSNPKTRRRN